MKNYLTSVSSSDKIQFEFSQNGHIDSKKYTLFEVLIDSRLDSLSFEERLRIFSSFNEDAEINNYTINQRYSTNGARTEKIVYDPSSNGLVKMINFGSNDYLNMSNHSEVINAAIEALNHYGAGAGASLPASGKTKLAVDLEKEIVKTFEYEDAIIYPSGYAANTGVLTGLLRSNDVAIVDMFAHASIMDGVENRNKMLFKHNDMRSLETVLSRANRQYANKIVVVDGVYSMDGDIANLPEISALCKKYGALLMVDEAHAFGVIGKNGMGILDFYNMNKDSIDILVGTLSKSVGCSGGFATGKKALIDYLKFSSRPYFFTTAPFLASNASAIKSIQIIREDSERKKGLWKNIDYLRAKITQGKFNIGSSQTAIFPIILGNHNRTLEISKIMGTNGVLANAVPYPAVSRKQTRIRMTVTSEMTTEQLDKGYFELCNAIKQAEQEEIENGKANLDHVKLLKAV